METIELKSRRAQKNKVYFHGNLHVYSYIICLHGVRKKAAEAWNRVFFFVYPDLSQ